MKICKEAKPPGKARKPTKTQKCDHIQGEKVGEQKPDDNNLHPVGRMLSKFYCRILFAVGPKEIQAKTTSGKLGLTQR